MGTVRECTASPPKPHHILARGIIVSGPSDPDHSPIDGGCAQCPFSYSTPDIELAMRSAFYLPAWICLLAAASVAAPQDTSTYRLPPEARKALVEMQATVHHGSMGGDLTAELGPSQVAALRQIGFDPTKMAARPVDETTVGGQQNSSASFHSYREMRAGFRAYASAHPNIAQFVPLGSSVQGRDIFGLKISGNVLVEEDEPEVVFWGGIHGDELPSAEIPYMYALELCDSYGVDPVMTSFVDDNEIWCIPMMNPDGHEMNTRENANGVDLNRDFGYQWTGSGSSFKPFSQLESQVTREFILSNNITLSTTSHCFGNVFLYPWGYSPNEAPDTSVFQLVGASYANAASYTLLKSWADYESHGELLDYLYGTHGGLCFTTEMAWQLSLLQDTWTRNRAGMNAFCRMAGGGLHGLVTDAQTGLPLLAAVWVSGSEFPSYTDAKVGDLHRIVEAGTYEVTVWANGYLPQTVSGVVVPPGLHPPGQFQVALQPSGSGTDHAFMVTAVNQNDHTNSYAQVTYPARALGAPDGIPCSLGRNGFIVLDLGPRRWIYDGPGDDFTITEAMLPQDMIPERYTVYGGNTYGQNTLIGAGRGTASFDLGATGSPSTRFLKIVDLSNSITTEPMAGLDLDGVTVLNGLNPGP